VQRLSGLSRRYLRERRGRTLLAGTGIVLGVAVLFSALVTIESYNQGMTDLGFESPGMDVTVFPTLANDGYLDDATVEGLRSLDGVDDLFRVHQVVVNFAHPRDPDTVDSDVSVWGIDVAEFDRFAEFESLYDLQPTSGRVFADDADEVMLSERYADHLGVAAGDRLTVTNLAGGPHPLLVAGVLPDDSFARRNDGTMLLTSLSTARRLNGRPGTVTFVALHLARGTDPDVWAAAHRDLDGVSVVAPGEFIQDRKSQLTDLGSLYMLFGALVLFVAGFLIFLTLSMAVTERQATLGVLRALGTSRRQLARLVLMEALVLGVLATAVGLALGDGIAYVNLHYQPFGQPPYAVHGVPVTAAALALAVGVGVGVSALAALVPARRAARLAPMDAIREPAELAGGSRRAWTVGLILLPIGWLVAASAPDDEVRTGVGLLLALGGAMLVVPAVLPWLCRRLAGLASMGPTRMAYVVVPHLGRERTRSAYTLGLAMVVMAMAIAMGATTASAMHTGEIQIAAQVQDTVGVFSGYLDEHLVRQVAAVDGIEAATPVWWSSTTVDADESPERRVVVVDPATHFAVSSFAWTEGSDESVARRLARSGQAAIPERLAESLDLSVDDTITMDTAEGPRPFVVAGVYVSVTPDSRRDAWGGVIVARQDGERFFATDWPAGGIYARLAPGADPDVVAGRVKELEGSTTFVVATPDQMRSTFDATMDQMRNLITSLLVPAAIISALGLANTLAVAVLERRREIGVLRAVGLSRGQARAMALLEATVLVGVAAVLAVPLGWALSRPVVAVAAQSIGIVVRYAFPWSWLWFAAVTALVLALIAAIAPARRAARVDVSAALRFE
jgi:putative ABC transport system permease protein